jgi:hypothetical protein
MTDRERLLDQLWPVAFAFAYRMLGSVFEAEVAFARRVSSDRCSRVRLFWL